MKTDSSQIAILRALVGPVVRFCLRNSIGFQQLAEVMKEELVQTAAFELRVRSMKDNASRLSVMTGLQRRDISRINFAERETTRRPTNLASRVIHTWQRDPRFRNKSGAPRVLNHRQEENEFRILVESVSKDINSATVLNELERNGAIERTKKGLKLVRDFQSFKDIPVKGIQLLAHDMETLSDAVCENLFTDQETKNVHLRTEYDNIFIREIPLIRSWLLEQGILFHRRLRDFLCEHDKDLMPHRNEPGEGKVSVTLFSWTEPKAVSENTNEKTKKRDSVFLLSLLLTLMMMPKMAQAEGSSYNPNPLEYAPINKITCSWSKLSARDYRLCQQRKHYFEQMSVEDKKLYNAEVEKRRQQANGGGTIGTSSRGGKAGEATVTSPKGGK